MEYGKPPKVATAAAFFQQLCYQNKNNLTAGIIIAGWDEEKGGQVFALPIGGALLQREYATGGARSTARAPPPPQEAAREACSRRR